MSLRLCKVLFNQKLLNVVNKKSRLINSSKLVSERHYENIVFKGENSNENLFFMNKDKQCCRNFIEKQTSLPIQWGRLEESLGVMESINIRSAILRTCQVLKKGDLAIDYCQYLVDKGEKLSVVEICLLLKTLAKCENNFKEHEKLLKIIFDHSNETVLNLEPVVKQAMKVFCQSNSCFKELILKYKEGKVHSSGIEKLIAALFDNNDTKLAWDIANENPEKFSSEVVESYFKFCIRMAEQNKFSVDMINDLINFFQTNSVIIKFDKLHDYVNQLTSALNKSETKEYLWSVSKCELVNEIMCSSCLCKLKPVMMKQEELEELKKNFLEKVIICYDINMKTTPKELENYMVFLENCSPYDMVIDGLNLNFGSGGKKVFNRKVLSNFEKQGMRILLVAKNHFKYSELYREVKRKWQIYLTRNDSLDDLFFLYAAMHGGLHTYFCTSDLLRDHAKFFDTYSLNVSFLKWQISHQYLIQPNMKMLKPRRHADTSQSSVVLDKNNKVKEYCWHLSYLKKGQRYRIEIPPEWICLRAKPVNNN